MTAFQTARLSVRAFEPSDFEELFAIMKDPVVMAFVGDGAPLGTDETRRWIRKSVENIDRFGYGTAAVIHRDRGSLIGWAGFARPDYGGQELIYGLSRAWWRQGYGREVLNGLVDFARERLNMNPVRAIIDPQNIASAKLLTAAGFRLISRAFEGDDAAHLYELDSAA